jgi:hypothetical protein
MVDAGAAGSLADAGGADTSVSGPGLLGPWTPTVDYPLTAATCAGSAPNLSLAAESNVLHAGRAGAYGADHSVLIDC